MTNNVGLTFSVGDTLSGLQLVLSKMLRIGDTKLLLNIGFVESQYCISCMLWLSTLLTR